MSMARQQIYPQNYAQILSHYSSNYMLHVVKLYVSKIIKNRKILIKKSSGNKTYLTLLGFIVRVYIYMLNSILKTD